jgi:hypothetical protein
MYKFTKPGAFLSVVVIFFKPFAVQAPVQNP